MPRITKFLVFLAVILLFSVPSVSASTCPVYTAVGDAWTCSIGGNTTVLWNATGSHTWTVPPGVKTVSLLTIGGGGGGGAATVGGGGGAGAYRYNQSFPVTPGANVPILVGAGGLPTANGGNSQFDGIISSGGARGGPISGNGYSNGNASGGGAGGRVNGIGGLAGLFGFFGGSTNSTIQGGAGGAGAGGNGTSITVLTFNNGTGGPGVQNSITGFPRWYAAGGAGGPDGAAKLVLGGSGIGGSVLLIGNSTDGVDGTGSGGASGSYNVSHRFASSGGDGVVIVSYKTIHPPLAFFLNNATGLPQPVDGARAMWLMGEGNGSIVNDVSGNGLNCEIWGTDAAWGIGGVSLPSFGGFINCGANESLNISSSSMTIISMHSMSGLLSYNEPFGSEINAPYPDYVIKMTGGSLGLVYNPAGTAYSLYSPMAYPNNTPVMFIGTVYPNFTMRVGNQSSYNFGAGSPSSNTQAFGAKMIGYSRTYGTARGTYYGTMLYPFSFSVANFTQMSNWMQWYYSNRGIHFYPTTSIPRYTAGTSPLPVQFTDRSIGATSWKWNVTPLGGSPTTISTAKNTSYVFTTGNYTVTELVSNPDGTNSMSVWVNVSPPPSKPVASFTALPLSGGRPLTVTFTDTSANIPTSWYWVFGDGNTSIAQNPVFTYTRAGNFSVNLTATNALGSNTSTQVTTISVTNQSPLLAQFTPKSPAIVWQPNGIAFKDTSVGSPTGWRWNFGDGTVLNGTANPYHFWGWPGLYFVSLNASVGSTYSTNSTIVLVMP